MPVQLDPSTAPATPVPACYKPGMETLNRMPGHLIRRAQQISNALFAQECGAFDLTAVQYAALHAIALHPEVDATRLSALIAFDRSTIGDVLERMEGKGWIERVPGVRDRRVKLVRLTTVGRRLLDQVTPAVHRVQERLLAPFVAGDRAVILRLLTQLAEQHGDTPG